MQVTYVLASHALADDLGMLVDEHMGLVAGSVDSSLGESSQLGLRGDHLSGRLEGF